ncbi:MAG: NAD-dependent malic enzyme, partial [Deltaproteobacteria bacterium]|nr:NAD-dependent malic enzyme [Deltaproteobacteria bacterium]
MAERTAKTPYEGETELAYLKRSTKLCRALAEDPSAAPVLTKRWNRVAIISDGSGIPGMGDVGPISALPFVESKSEVFRRLAGIEALPLVLASGSADGIVRAAAMLSPSVGAINLEGISEGRCLEIRERLQAQSDLPVFQDNLDAIPIVCLAALLNALRLVGKPIGEVTIVISGTDLEATPMVEFLAEAGASDIIVCDRAGAIHRGRPGPTSWVMESLAQRTNPRQLRGGPAKALAGADVFISLSGPPVLDPGLLASMGPRAILLYLTDCAPEFFAQAGNPGNQALTATTCPALPNHLTNCLVFPGLLRGSLDAMARLINMPMKMAAALSLSGMIPEDVLGPELLIPQAL